MSTTPTVSTRPRTPQRISVLRREAVQTTTPVALSLGLAAVVAASSALGWLLASRRAVRLAGPVAGLQVALLGGVGLFGLSLVRRAEQARLEALDEATASHNQLQKLID